MHKDDSHPAAQSKAIHTPREGLGDVWAPIRKYWRAPTAENRDVLRKTILTLGGTRWQYTHGVADPQRVACPRADQRPPKARAAMIDGD
jgi:hypothetical protein